MKKGDKEFLEDLEALYDPELVRELSDKLDGVMPLRPPKFGITAQEHALITKCSVNTARKELEQRILNNGWKKQEMRYANAHGHVYFKPKKENPK